MDPRRDDQREERAARRPSASEIARRGPARSSTGTSSGPATARGAIVSSRYAATLHLGLPDGDGEEDRVGERDRDRASPATLPRCASAYALDRILGVPHPRERTPRGLQAVAASPRRTSRHQGNPFAGRRVLAAAARSHRGARLLRQARSEQLAGELRVRRAPDLLHHLADEEPEHALLPAAELLDGLGVLGDHLVDDAPSSPSSETCSQALALRRSPSIGVAGLERLLERLLRAGRRDGSVADQLDELGEVLRRDLSLGELDVRVRFTWPARSWVIQFAAAAGVGAGRDGLLEERRPSRPIAASSRGLCRLQTELGLVARATGRRQLGQGRADLLDPRRDRARAAAGRARGSTGSRTRTPSSAAVRRARRPRPSAASPARATRRASSARDLALLLVAERAFERADRVQVLDLDLRAELRALPTGRT